jgi:hypothetical protein
LLHAGVGNLARSQMILEHDFVDLRHGVSGQLVGPDVDPNDVLVAFEGILEGGGVALLDLVAAHVQTLDVLVRLEELGERLAEHVSELVGAETNVLQARIIVQQVNAKLAASFIVKTVQLEV